MRILFIEDDAEFAAIAERLLSHSGIPLKFSVCPTLRDGLIAAEITKPDRIFLDINLVETRGFETVAGIPGLDKFAPVIIVSGLGFDDIDEEILKACYAAGAVGHIFKRNINPSSANVIAGLLLAAGFNWIRIHKHE